MSAPGTDPDQAAEELRLLALGLLDRAEPGLRALLAGLRERVEQASGTEHSAACTWCPLCATVGLLRGERPELAAAIAAHAGGLVAALRTILTPPPTGPAGSAGSAGSAGPPPEPPPVQHIEVRRAGEAGSGC
jgi:hypothetical protein